MTGPRTGSPGPDPLDRIPWTGSPAPDPPHRVSRRRRACATDVTALANVAEMLGVSHATSGAALGLAVAGYVPRLAGIEPVPARS